MEDGLIADIMHCHNLQNSWGNHCASTQSLWENYRGKGTGVSLHMLKVVFGSGIGLNIFLLGSWIPQNEGLVGCYALLSLRSKQLVWRGLTNQDFLQQRWSQGLHFQQAFQAIAVSAASAGLWTPPLEMRVKCIAENWRTRGLIIHNNAQFCHVGCRHFTFYLVFMGNFGDRCCL